ncbi:MAG: hypothetical protein NTZ90_09520 [Proteobacteria bacterium]|nr:hypothetical protein [Pseudomonadota bacterium]
MPNSKWQIVIQCGAAVALILSSLHGCKHASDDAGSELQHTPGKTVFAGRYPQFPVWSEVADKDLGKESNLTISDTDLDTVKMPQVVQFQSQIDKLHAAIVKSTGQNIPRPKLIVRGSTKDPNAFVLSVPYCLPIEFKWDDALPQVRVLWPTRGTTTPINPQRMDESLCRPVGKLTDNEASALISEVFGFDSNCVTTTGGASGTQASRLDKKCLTAALATNENALIKMVGGGTLVVIPSTLNWIFMTPAMLRMPEDQALALVFHELAHYYRAHMTFGRGYDYFYLLDAERNESKAPTPLDRSHPLYKLGLELKGVMYGGALTPEQLALLKQAKEGRLGFYTTEQEADELALEYLKTMGKKPASLADALLAVLSGDDRTPYPYPEELMPRYKACADQRAKGFPQFVGVGYYDDPHHSLCYRIYNIEREIKAHGY